MPVTQNMIVALFVKDNWLTPNPIAYNYTIINVTPRSVPITLTNNQSAPTSNAFQQLIIVNSAKYYGINSNWSNVEFTTEAANGLNINGTVLPAWVESNATNTSAHTLVWVRLSNSIPANGGNTIIYMNIMPGNVMSANGPTGEAPQLSSAYGQYDNGNSVFTNYSDFVGNYSGGANETINNTIVQSDANTDWTVYNGLTWTGIIKLPSVTVSSSSFSDTKVAIDVSTLPGSISYQVSCQPYGHCPDVVTPIDEDGFVGMGYLMADGIGGYVYYTYNSISYGEDQHSFGSMSVPVSLTVENGQFYVQSNYGTQKSNGTALVGAPETFQLQSNDGLQAYNGWHPYPQTIHWIRTRAAPPYGIMPNVSFGIISSFSNPTATAVSQLDQTISFTANAASYGESGQPPYTYTFYVMNALTNSVVQTATYTTNSTSYTQNFTVGANDLTNLPEVVMVSVADSASRVSTSYSSPIVAFTAFPLSFLPLNSTNVVDQGGSGSWTLNTMAPGPYDLNASVYSSNNMLAFTFNTPYLHGPQSHLTIPIPANFPAGNYTLNVTLNEWANESDNTYVGSGTNSTTFTVNPKLSVGLPIANQTQVALGDNVILSANVTGGTPPYDGNYVWFYGADPNCTTDVPNPQTWDPGNAVYLNYSVGSNTFSIPINSTTFFCYYAQDSAGAWGLSNTIAIAIDTRTPPPTGYPNVTVEITNNKGSATPSQFQQMVSLDPQFVGNVSSDLGNIRFYAGRDELYSWCESGCSSSRTNAIFWVKLPNSIGANSNTTINMTFLPTTTEYDNNYAGEAPQLSPNYAEYDNGNKVFYMYDNFSGTNLRDLWAAWNYSGSTTVTVDNGVTLTNTGNGGSVQSTSNYNPQLYIGETYGKANNDNTNRILLSLWDAVSNTWSILNGGTNGDWTLYVSTPFLDMGAATDTSMHIFSVWENSTKGSGMINYSHLTIGSVGNGGIDSSTNFNPVYANGGNSAFAQYARLRLVPPDRVMPNVTLGGGGYAPPTTTSTTITTSSTSTTSSSTSTSTSSSTSTTTSTTTTSSTSTSATTTIAPISPNVTVEITNNQSSATPVNFDQRLVIDMTGPLWQNVSSDLGNIRFYHNSTILNSWCESNCTNTTTRAVFYVNMSDDIIGAYSTKVINATFLSKSIEYDGHYAGLAPNLTTPYAKWDNMRRIFAFADDFNGTSLNSTAWNLTGSVTVNDGLTESGNPVISTWSTYDPSSYYTMTSWYDTAYGGIRSLVGWTQVPLSGNGYGTHGSMIDCNDDGYDLLNWAFPSVSMGSASLTTYNLFEVWTYGSSSYASLGFGAPVGNPSASWAVNPSYHTIYNNNGGTLHVRWTAIAKRAPGNNVMPSATYT